MNMFKRLGSILALAVSFCVMPFAQAADRVFEYAVYGDTASYGSAKAKLEADLVHQADAKVAHVGRSGSGLDRDSNGFRQHSAMELSLSNPAPSTFSLT